MSDDLVKRLRDVAGVIIGAQSQNLEEDYGLAREAADLIEKLEAALRSIAANACCDSCHEAALVARKALEMKND